MRKSKQETAETRKRIVETASAEFRRNGVEGTGISELMAAAGLTHGGFYKHFASKEQLVGEALTVAIESLNAELENKMLSSVGERGLNAAIALYLSAEHRDDPACGCPMAALGSEVARGDDALRATATEGFLKMVDLFAARFTDLPPAAAKKEALVTISTLVGAVILSRVVDDPDLSGSILRQAKKQLTR